jgi:hypothetical protein
LWRVYALELSNGSSEPVVDFVNIDLNVSKDLAQKFWPDVATLVDGDRRASAVRMLELLMAAS